MRLSSVSAAPLDNKKKNTKKYLIKVLQKNRIGYKESKIKPNLFTSPGCLAVLTFFFFSRDM